MSDKSAIEWTDATWNPLTGCARVSEGCRNCYAELLSATRLARAPKFEGAATMTAGGPRWSGVVKFHADTLDHPVRWQRPRRVFVNSMSDTFHEAVGNEELDQMFAAMAAASWHRFQVLTKRPERARTYLNDPETPERVADRVLTVAGSRRPSGLAVASMFGVAEGLRKGWRWPLSNVWLGTSTEDQRTADQRIPILLDTRAAVRFISAEPLLGPLLLDYRHYIGNEEYWDFLKGERGATVQHQAIAPRKTPALDWVIVGGESGPNARPMHPDWAESIRYQCVTAGVPFFFKQWGEWATVATKKQAEAVGPRRTARERWLNYEGGHGFHGDRVVLVRKVGKHAAGRVLGGREWNEAPDGDASKC